MKSPRILVVEDEPIIGMDIRDTLIMLGYDVLEVITSGEEAIEKAEELKPDIIGLGAYMTTTMLLMKDVIDALSENGLRDRIKLIIGGVPTSQKFSDEIGSDAWGKDALDTLDKVKQLMEAK